VSVWRRVSGAAGDDADCAFARAAVLRNHSHIVWQCCFNADGSRFATASEDGSALVFDTASATEMACFAPACGLRSVGVVYNDTIVAGGGDGMLYVVNLVRVPSRW
jgi:WD40 repeat protein